MAQIKTTVTAEFDIPMTVEDLTEIIAMAPRSATVEVDVVLSGDQRDPYPVKYRFTASWDPNNA